MFYSAPPLADIWQSIIITGGNPWWRADFRWEWRTAGAHSDQSTLFLHICIRPPPARPPPRRGRKSIKGLVDTFIEKKTTAAAFPWRSDSPSTYFLLEQEGCFCWVIRSSAVNVQDVVLETRNSESSPLTQRRKTELQVSLSCVGGKAGGLFLQGTNVWKTDDSTCSIRPKVCGRIYSSVSMNWIRNSVLEFSAPSHQNSFRFWPQTEGFNLNPIA